MAMQQRQLRPSMAQSFGQRSVQPGGGPGGPGDDEAAKRFSSSTGFGSGPESPAGGGANFSNRGIQGRVSHGEEFVDTGTGEFKVADALLGGVPAELAAINNEAYLLQNPTAEGGTQDQAGAQPPSGSYEAEIRTGEAVTQAARDFAGGGGGGTGGGERSPSDAAGTPFAKGGPVGEVKPMGTYEHGGQVAGPGDGNDDAIKAQLSNGEFVIQAQAAQALGPEILAALNDPQTAARLAAVVRQEMFAGGMKSGMQNGGPNQGPAAPPMPGNSGQMANATPPGRGGALSQVY